MIWFVLFPFFLLISGPDVVSAVSAALLYIAGGLLITHFSRNHSDSGQQGFRLEHPLPAVGIGLTAGICYYLRWQDAAVFRDIAIDPNFPAKRICGAAAAVLVTLSIYGIDLLLRTAFQVFRWKKTVPENVTEKLYIGLTSVSVITLVSNCSPFYAFNDWVDPHTMFSVGKAILHGMMPYRDVFEQKGPVILLLHAFAALISRTSLTGVWILEIISCFLFLYCSCQIMKIRLGKAALPLIPVLALISYTVTAFAQGDSAEEFCLPVLAYGLLVGYRSIANEKLPASREWFFVGLSSGLVLWTKYSMLGFYFGCFFALFLYAKKNKRLPELWRGVGRTALGLGCISLCILLWFMINGAAYNLFETYFYQNLFLYPKTADIYGHLTLIRNLGNGLLNFLVFCAPVFFLSLSGIIWAGKNEKKDQFLLIISSLCGLLLSVYISGRFYSYYPLVFSVYTIFGLLWISGVIHNVIRKKAVPEHDTLCAAAYSLCFCIICVFFCSGNMRSLGKEKQDYPQYRAKALIESSGIEDPSLMNYQYLDMGVNTAADLLPTMRFFCGFNLPLKEISEEQNACLDTGCVDFVMTYMLEINSPNYELLERFPLDFHLGKIQPTYNLYQKIR